MGHPWGKSTHFENDQGAEWAQCQYGRCRGWRGKDKSLALPGIKTMTN